VEVRNHKTLTREDGEVPEYISMYFANCILSPGLKIGADVAHYINCMQRTFHSKFPCKSQKGAYQLFKCDLWARDATIELYHPKYIH
jgi:hypothetical protein